MYFSTKLQKNHQNQYTTLKETLERRGSRREGYGRDDGRDEGRDEIRGIPLFKGLSAIQREGWT